ncbi:MAG TPA: holo-ACP synthase [Bacillota bacterium]|nr:holo-ACP synthase [Bacillota bacterium]
MIVGVGVDLISIKRVDKACRRNPERFLKRLFSSAELALLAPRPAPVRSAAARFAAKEAVLKAIGCGIGPAALREVEILAPPGRKPQVRLSGHAARQAAAQGITGIEVSLTHDPPFAAAIAVAYKRQESGGLEQEKEH